MNSVYRVNLTTLKTRLESIQNERNSFINYTYKTFLDGYLNYTSEYEIVEMKNTLTTLYNNIQTAYDNIIKWFSNYISDVENLELTMVTRTNKLNSTGTYSYRILSQINPYIMMNKNDVSMAPSVTEKMKQYINKKKEELDVELNKIDDRMAYIEKFGEEVGTEKYNAAIEHINLKSAEYDEELKFLSDEARYAGVIDDPEFIMLQNQIDLFKKTRDDLYIEIQAELDNVDLEHGEMSPELQEKIALYQELDYYIVELEKQKEMFPYYSLLSTEEYMLFKQNYDPEKIFASYEDLTTSEGTVDFLTMYEYYKNTLYEGREDLTFDEANQLDVFGSYMITDYMPIEDFYNYTTEEQKELYHFIYATRGEKAARAFADLLVDDINKAKGAELALDFIEEFDEYYASQQSDNALESILGTFATYSTVKIKGLTDGVDSFFDSYLNSNNHHMTADEYARAIIYTHLNEKSDFYAKEYQFNSVVGRIAPMIAVTALTSYVSTPAGVSGGSTISDFVSTGLIFTSSYGDAKHNALVSGYSGSSARLYAFLSGMSEACLERLIGNIPFLSKQSSFTLKGLLSEGFEEAFQEYLDAGYRAILFGEPFDITNLSSDALTAFIYGIMTSGYLNGIETVITVIIDGESYEVDMQELIEKINNTENIDSEQIKTIFAEIKVKIDNPLMNIKVSKEQLNSGIESLAIAHPKYAYKLYSIKEKLSKNSITLDEAVMEYSNIYSDILKNDWYSLETGNFDMNAMNFKSKIAEYENLSHYEIEEDGSYTFYYESVNYDVEGIVRYALANGYDLDADTKELLNKMEELCKNKKSSMSEIKINDYYGSPQYMTENTNAIAEGYSELLNSKYITDDERNELFSKAEEFQTLVNEINELYSVSKDSISKEQYKKMVEKYKRLLELENEMAKINGNAWERYYNNTNAFLCHTFSGEIVSAYDLKDHSVKVCTSLVTDTDGHFAYGNVGIEFRPSIDNVDNFSKDDAGSWDTDEDKFLNNFVYGDGTSCAQFDDNRIVYEAADHSRLIPPESMEAAIKNAGNYTEIVLINNENLVPSSYFYTQNATPEEIAKIKELAIKDGVPLEMINTVTFERIPIPLD